MLMLGCGFPARFAQAAASAEVERATASCSTVSEVQDERSLDIVSPERARLLPPVQPQATVAFPEVSADAVPEADIATAATTASPSETESVVQDTPVESANSAVVEPSLVFTPADAAPAPSLPEPDVLPDAVVLVPAPAAFSESPAEQPESPAEQPESQPAAISSELIAEPLAAADAAPLPDLTPTSQLSDSSTPSSEPAPRRGRLSLQKVWIFFVYLSLLMFCIETPFGVGLRRDSLANADADAVAGDEPRHRCCSDRRTSRPAS